MNPIHHPQRTRRRPCSKRQSLELLPRPPVQLLRLALARADEADLGPERGEPVADGRLLGALQDGESTQRVGRLLERLVRLGNLLAQRLGPVLVPAQVQVQLLLELVALFGRRDELVEDGLRLNC